MRTKIIKVDANNPDPKVIREAADTLRRGGLVAFPTETVYGLGASLQDPQAIQELYRVKQRPFEKKVTVHIWDLRQVEEQGCRMNEMAAELAGRFWPGPLTVVLKRRDGSTLGFRMPDHPVALALLKEADVPVVAPSANLSGSPAPRSAPEVLRDLSDEIDLLLDAGPAPVGIESTVLDLSGPVPVLLRAGALSSDVSRYLERIGARSPG
ncbi:MAG: L-threonylcarbamoyladenylate synthase [Candidatus Omnitrophica bacterium]|nr:L-threonylcarbamoyladenylate synthase [Candidatus Omnitrophota bacterium]